MNQELTTRETCNSCGGILADVFSMGTMPLANALLSYEDLPQAEKSYPLTLSRCMTCSLVQLRHVVDPIILYDDYCFFSGASSPSKAYFHSLAETIGRKLPHLSKVIEIGSNDGTLLKELEQQGLIVTGVDPAIEQCEQARQRLVRGDVICGFWTEKMARTLPKQKCIVACNVLGHSDNLPDFLAGCRAALTPDGILIIEVQYLKTMLSGAIFEVAYHEHVSYFDEVSLGNVLRCHGFDVIAWEATSVQCGTLRMWAKHSSQRIVDTADRNDWRQFRADVEHRRSAIAEALEETRGKSVCFYGAPAKATQIANYLRIGTDAIQFAVDCTPAKQGKLIPGARIPIVDPSELAHADVALVAAWNYYDAIAAQELAFSEHGGRLICPTVEGIACPA